jgi:lipopolysaccharide heptosyltransferase I
MGFQDPPRRRKAARRRRYTQTVADPERILIIRPSALGDVCRSVPVAVSLRKRFPNAEIHWLVQAGFEAAIAAHPAVDRVIPFDRRAMAISKLHRGPARRLLLDLVRRLRRGGYDLVLDCQGLARSGFFAFCTRAPRRIGYADAREGASVLLTQRVRTDEPHTVDRMLALAAAAGAEPIADLRLYVPSDASDELPAPLRAGGHVLVAPTSRWPGKRWPEPRFIDLVRGLIDHEPTRRIAIVASAGEREQCARLLRAFEDDERVIDLVGATSVAGLMAAVERSALVVANDSAALHIAVGFEKPLVGLFGPTRIDRVGPYRRESDVLQPEPPPERVSHKDDRAGLAMMERIAAEDVLHAALAQLPGGIANEPTPAVAPPGISTTGTARR